MKDSLEAKKERRRVQQRVTSRMRSGWTRDAAVATEKFRKGGRGLWPGDVVGDAEVIMSYGHKQRRMLLFRCLRCTNLFPSSQELARYHSLPLETKLALSRRRHGNESLFSCRDGHERQTHGIFCKLCREATRDELWCAPGEKFGMAEVLWQFRSGRRDMVMCRCECGNLFQRLRYFLLSGSLNSCGCTTTRFKPGNKPHNWPTHHGDPINWSQMAFGDISGRMWKQITVSATTRKLPLTVDAAYCWSLFLSQDGRCALSGVPICFASKTASLDRIDSRLGYVPGNLQWVHKIINRMKADLPDEQFRHWCRLVAGVSAPAGARSEPCHASNRQPDPNGY